MRDIKDVKRTVDELFELKKRLRYPTKELAKMFHVSVRTIQKWGNRTHLPQPVYIPMIKKLVEIGKKGKLYRSK